jgi:hypothetical protein
VSFLRVRMLISTSVFLVVLAMTCTAQVPAPRVVDLTSPDGVNLKATNSAASKPGPGILGSAQEFVETRILGCFLKNDEFGLCDRHALSL